MVRIIFCHCNVFFINFFFMKLYYRYHLICAHSAVDISSPRTFCQVSSILLLKKHQKSYPQTHNRIIQCDYTILFLVYCDFCFFSGYHVRRSTCFWLVSLQRKKKEIQVSSFSFAKCQIFSNIFPNTEC